jgi:hypothetical protein
LPRGFAKLASVAFVASSLLVAGHARSTDTSQSASPAVEGDVAAGRAVAPNGPPKPPDFGPAPALHPQPIPPPPPAPTLGPMTDGPSFGLVGSKIPGEPAIGRQFAVDNCRPCHVVMANQTSAARFATGPKFRDVAHMKQMTPMSLNIWLTNPHPTMPTLRLTAEEAANVVAEVIAEFNGRERH